MTRKVLDSRRELELSRDQRMEADQNSRNTDNVQKFIGRIPEKALRSTFMIRDDEVQIASNQGTVDSVYNNAVGTVSGNVMSQTATMAWQEGTDGLDNEILASSIQRQAGPRPKTNDKTSANMKKLPPMLPIDASI